MIDVEIVKVKVKNGNLQIISGLVIEDKLMDVPLEVVPLIKWNKEVKLLVINALIKKNHLDVVVEMSGGKMKLPEKIDKGWEDAKN